MKPRSLTRTTLATLGGLALLLPAGAAHAKPDTGCQQAGMQTLRSAGLLDDVARDGLAVTDALALGVTARPSTDVGALPDRLPLSVVLADHRAGDDSLLIYPWCS